MYREIYGADEKDKYTTENSAKIDAVVKNYSLTNREAEILKMLTYGEDTIHFY